MHNELFSIGPVVIHGYGLMIALGFFLCVVMGMYRAKKWGLNAESILDIALIGIVAGFIGAKLLFVIVVFPSFLENPFKVLGSEGFVVYGGIIAGVVSAMIYCRIKKLTFIKYFDLAAPSIALAQAFGRIGCFLAGCCYGRETSAWFGVTFPQGSMAPAGISLIPTQLLSSLGDFIIVGILLLYNKKAKYHGDVGAMYMLLYGVGRFLIELLRWDDRGFIGPLSTSQIISIFIVVGAVLLFRANKKRPRTEAQQDPEQEAQQEEV